MKKTQNKDVCFKALLTCTFISGLLSTYRLSLLLLCKAGIRRRRRRSRAVVMYHIRVHDVVYMYIGLLSSHRGCHWCLGPTVIIRRLLCIVSERVAIKLTGGRLTGLGVSVLSYRLVFNVIHDRFQGWREHLDSWRVSLGLFRLAEIAQSRVVVSGYRCARSGVQARAPMRSVPHGKRKMR